jgi:hypothetical protein
MAKGLMHSPQCIVNVPSRNLWGLWDTRRSRLFRYLRFKFFRLRVRRRSWLFLQVTPELFCFLGGHLRRLKRFCLFSF